MSERNNRDGTPAAAGEPELRPYDFRRPYKAQVQRPSATATAAAIPTAAATAALESVHARFATRLAAALSAHLRVDVAVMLAQVEQLTYDEFLYSIGPVTCLSVLRVDPPGAQAIFDLSLPVVSPMIDRLLGGSSQSNAQSPRHALTEIEKGLALQIIERAAAELAETWNAGSSMPISVREEALESDPLAVRIMPGEEVVTALRFEVRIASGGAGGTMSLCLSQPILAELDPLSPPAGTSAAPSVAETEAQRQDLHRNILESAVELRALLAQTKLRLSDVLDMQVGDVITTDKAAGEDVQLQVEGKEKLHGQAGQLYGNRVVQITRLPRLEEEENADENRPAAAAPTAAEPTEPARAEEPHRSRQPRRGEPT